MKTFSRKNTMAAVILAAASVGLPTMAQAGHASTSNYRYEECKKSDTESQIIGGVLGAVLGGVAGSEIAGRGDRNEGTAIGAAAGAAAGIALANKDCKKRAGIRPYSTSNNYSTNRNYPTSRNYPASHNYGSNSYGRAYNTHYPSSYGNSYGNSYGYQGYSSYGNSRSRGHNHGYNNQRRQYTPYQSRNHVCSNRETKLEHINWQIDELRREREYLERQQRYVSYDYRIGQRMREIGNEIGRLKDKKRYVKDYSRDRGRNDYYYKTRN